MLLRRHRKTPDFDRAFDKTPADTLDPAFGPAVEDVAELKGKALDAALDDHGLSKEGTADETRERLSRFLTGTDLI